MSAFIVGLDIDGVIAANNEYVCERLGLDPTKVKTWNWSESFGPGVEERAIELYQRPEIWVGCQPMPRARDAVKLLMNARKLPIFISDFPIAYKPLRRWWINHRLFDGRGPLVYLFACARHNKLSTAKSLGITHFVEDNPHTANEFAKAGITSYLVESSYMTDGGKVTPHRDVIVVPNVYAAVEDMLRG